MIPARGLGLIIILHTSLYLLYPSLDLMCSSKVNFFQPQASINRRDGIYSNIKPDKCAVHRLQWDDKSPLAD